MPTRAAKIPIRRVVSLAIALALCGACYSVKGKVPRKEQASPKRVVVSGFHPFLPPDGEAKIVRSPLTGAVFMAGPVPEEVARDLTNTLFEKLVPRASYELIAPDRTAGLYSEFLSSDPALSEIEIYQRMGQIFSADAVLTGYVYRWKEREGTDYAVSRPASVAFDLYLISTPDGEILWKDRFDKTQRSLSENLLDFNTFLKSKGQWMHARELAAVGLSDLVENLLSHTQREKDS